MDAWEISKITREGNKVPVGASSCSKKSVQGGCGGSIWKYSTPFKNSTRSENRCSGRVVTSLFTLSTIISKTSLLSGSLLLNTIPIFTKRTRFRLIKKYFPKGTSLTLCLYQIKIFASNWPGWNDRQFDPWGKQNFRWELRSFWERKQLLFVRKGARKIFQLEKCLTNLRDYDYLCKVAVRGRGTKNSGSRPKYFGDISF